MKSAINRRRFIQSTAAAAAAPAVLGSSKKDAVPAGPPLKIGLVGCGSRGRGAVGNALQSAPNIKVTALADVFDDRVREATASFAEAGQEVSPGRCFVGFDAFRQVLETDVDYVILATPPHFRPEHFRAVVEAGKHAFIEKPVAVDPAGIRTMFEAAARSEKKGLSVAAGTQRRHALQYIETHKRIADGAIGEVVSARGAWNQGALWHRMPRPERDEMANMIRNWVNWTWLSGDHIVEQHVHQIDVIHWFLGKNPVSANGFGGRHRRVTGDQYDFFTVEYAHDDGVRFHSQARQINGCFNNVSEALVGTRGSTNCADLIFGPGGEIVWEYEGEKPDPYVQEHADLVRAIRTGRPINEARQVAESSLTAIMGRVSAYSGQTVGREEVLKSSLRLGPGEYQWGGVAVSEKMAIAGKPAGPPRKT